MTRMVDLSMINIAQQAVEAKEAGAADVAKLLQQPEDLERLPALRSEYDQRHKANKQQLSATIQSQVENARYGLELLDKSHRNIAKLRTCLDKIEQLCVECSCLVENHEKIRELSMTHKNVDKVLDELEDIIDLPARADMVLEMLEDDTNLLRSFEGLIMLEGTASNAKQAWNRNVKKRQDISDLAQYLGKVDSVRDWAEGLLWGHMREYHDLAKSNPRLLVDCLQVVQLQEQVDRQYQAAKLHYIKPKRYKDRCFLEVELAIAKKFDGVLQRSNQCGVPNAKVRYDQYGNVVVSEERDYLGTLIAAVRVDPQGKPVATPVNELPSLDLTSVEEFAEDTWVEALIDDMTALENELADVFDFVSPCFPPYFGVFEQVQQHYHVRFAQVIDHVGRAAERLSTKNLLKIMGWVSQYQDTLRNLGVEEALVHLPIAPQSDPEGRPGLKLLIEVYTDRMEQTVSAWCKNILEADTQREPTQMADGSLRTPGAVDFFRILNEEVAIIEDISRGEILYEASKHALAVMKGFQDQQLLMLRRDLSLEMLSALLNNNVDCYNQSLEFTEHVQELLEEQYKEKIDVEEVCRGFLEASKFAMKRVVDFMFQDPGMVSNLKCLFMTSDWSNGTVTATVIATITDYFGDLAVYVDGGFFKRLVEATLEDYVRRYVTQLMAAIPTITDTMVRRMAKDEEEMAAFFAKYLKQEKVTKYIQQMQDLRALASSDSVDSFVLSYSNILNVNSAITPNLVEKLCACRSDMSKADQAEVISMCKDVHKQRQKMRAAQGGVPEAEGKGFFASLLGGKGK